MSMHCPVGYICSLFSSPGNVTARGEKIYHMPGTRSYVTTRIDGRHGERYFCSEADAQAAGWRPAR